jgi:AsmA family protein
VILREREMSVKRNETPIIRSLAMSPGVRFPVIDRKIGLPLGTVLVLALVLTLFDWNWLRQPLVRYVAGDSGREVRVDDLDVTLGLNPTIRMRGVYVANAPWASTRTPFASAREASFTVSLRSVWEGRPVVSRLVLVDADIDMERLEDGRRNWRIREAGRIAPGRLTIHTLEAHRTRIRFANRQTGLDVTAVASPAEGQGELTTRVAFTGSYQGAAFSGEAFNQGVVSFRGSDFTFPLRGFLISRKTRIDLDGLFTNFFDLGPMDTHIRVTGPTLSLLHPFIPIHPSESHPFDLSAQLVQTDNVYRFTQLVGKLGKTDLAGDATLDRSGERPRVRARLRSASAELDDLRPLVGLPSGRSGESGGRARSRFSERRLDVAKLGAFDASVSFEAVKLASAAWPALDSLNVVGELNGGHLQVKPLRIGLAGGRVAGTAAFDTRKELPQAQIELELSDLRLEKLASRLAAKDRFAAPIGGRVKLASSGQSVAALVANASGVMNVRIGPGRMSNLADAKLALNFGKVISLFVRGDRDIALRCAAADFNVRNATATSKDLVLDSAETRVTGVASLDLKSGEWEALLTPDPKRPGLFTRRASVRLHGFLHEKPAGIDKPIIVRRVENGNSGAADAGCERDGTTQERRAAR